MSPTIGENARTAIAGFGLEWLLPVGALISVVVLILSALRIPADQQGLFVISSLVWSILMFSAIHNAMHLNEPRLMRVPLLRHWFLRARRLHDIHHVQIDSRGLMTKNFGICFFFMDRISGTLQKRSKPFDEEFYRRALNRYSFIGD